MQLHRFRQPWGTARILVTIVVMSALVFLGNSISFGQEVLRVGIRTGITTLDHHGGASVVDTRINQNIHDYLLRFAGDGTLQPALATRWWVSNDGLTWTFELRDDAYFHNGEKVTAEAVKYSFERLMDPNYPNQQRSLFTMVREVTVDDEYTVSFHLDTPNPLLTRSIAYGLSIVPPKYTQSVSREEFSRNPVGAGPYKVVEWRRGEELILEAFEDYYLGPPAYKRVSFRFIPDDVSRVNALLAGDLDIAGPIASEHIPIIEATPGVRVSRARTLERRMIIIDTHTPPFNDVRVRQALNHAVDVQAIIDNILDGLAFEMSGGVSPLEFGYAPLEPYRYDPEKAKALLAEAGYPNGFSTKLYVPIGRYVKGELVAEAIAGYLADVGIKTELVNMEYTTFVQMARERKLSPLFMLGWQGGGVFHPDNVFRLVFMCGGGSPQWGGWYCNPEVDRIYEEGVAADARGDSERAIELYQQAQKMVRDDAPWIFLYGTESAYGVSNRVQWELNSAEQLFMFDAKPAR